MAEASEQKKDIGSVELPNAKDRLDPVQAGRVKALILLDIARFETEAVRIRGLLLQTEAAIAQCRESIADIDRRVADVDYPPQPEPKKPEEK